MHETVDPETSHIIEMAWDDETSFDAIEAQTGMTEKDVIALMRRTMKPSSFRMWRKRVIGRKAKHDSRMRPAKLSINQKAYDDD